MEELTLIKEKPWKGKKEFRFTASDEVGRGPLAGPVVACTVSISGDEKFFEDNFMNGLRSLKEMGVTDSKKMTVLKRKRIFSSFLGNDRPVRLGEPIALNPEIFPSWTATFSEVNAETIDKINILQASLLAMKKSFDVCHEDIPAWWWIDGNKRPELDESKYGNVNVSTLIKGDSRSLLIGVSSILAKVHRDDLMESLANDYPEYGFDKHAGYPTKAHKQAIEEHGVSPVHRRSFRGVREFL